MDGHRLLCRDSILAPTKLQAWEPFPKMLTVAHVGARSADPYEDWDLDLDLDYGHGLW